MNKVSPRSKQRIFYNRERFPAGSKSLHFFFCFYLLFLRVTTLVITYAIKQEAKKISATLQGIAIAKSFCFFGAPIIFAPPEYRVG